MPLYRYEAINERGETEQGMMEVGDEIALYETLRARGWVLVKASRKAVPLMRKKKVTPRALAEFCRHMDHVIRAGIPILQGLEDIMTATTDEFFKGVLLAIIRDIENGKSFSEALEAHPHVFSRFFIAVVRAGETTGQLDKSFHDLAAYLEWTINLKARIKQAITYPIIVIVLIVIALIIFITYVIPKLVKFISEMNMPLPLPFAHLSEDATGEIVGRGLLHDGGPLRPQDLLEVQPGGEGELDQLVLQEGIVEEQQDLSPHAGQGQDPGGELLPIPPESVNPFPFPVQVNSLHPIFPIKV